MLMNTKTKRCKMFADCPQQSFLSNNMQIILHVFIENIWQIIIGFMTIFSFEELSLQF